jgi:hypothetical protein
MRMSSTYIKNPAEELAAADGHDFAQMIFGSHQMNNDICVFMFVCSYLLESIHRNKSPGDNTSDVHRHPDVMKDGDSI